MLELFSVHSTQTAEQRHLSARFAAVAGANSSLPLGVNSFQLEGLSANTEFRSDGWYSALVQKTAHWARVAESHIGQLVLCSDNDVSLLPGWAPALLEAFGRTGEPLDLCFMREGGEDPFFDPWPYNSGFFMMNGSVGTAAFWREVSHRTSELRPGMGDQAVVNSMLVHRAESGQMSCPAQPALRHAHFPPRLVVGGPSWPDSQATLLEARAHHATGSGDAAGKLRALDGYLDAWLSAANQTRAQLGLPVPWAHERETTRTEV